MNANKRIIATVELVLIFPAALFLSAVVTRYLLPVLYEPAHFAQQVVMWYSGRVWTLWVLLIGLPMAALLTGSATLLWNSYGGSEAGQPSEAIRAHLPRRIIMAETLAAGLILVVVALHMLAN